MMPRRATRQRERAYQALLRRAASIGWQAAKEEYEPRARANGRDVEDIRKDLELFERLNRATRSTGIDPIVAQRVLDIYAFWMRPMLAGLGGLSVALFAMLDLHRPLAVWLGLAVTLTARFLVRTFVVGRCELRASPLEP